MWPVDELLRSTRSFRLWRARVSHGELLLRSVKNGEPTRIDALFKPVLAMKLKTTLLGLLVRPADRAEQAAIEREVGRNDGAHVFIVESADFSGYVVASTFAWHEDDREYHEPSHFDQAEQLLL